MYVCVCVLVCVRVYWYICPLLSSLFALLSFFISSLSLSLPLSFLSFHLIRIGSDAVSSLSLLRVMFNKNMNESHGSVAVKYSNL